VVPTTLITKLSGVNASAQRCISTLAKENLIAKVKNTKCELSHFLTPSQQPPLVLIGVLDDGYRLTYGGLDYLALHTHQKANTIYSVGNQIGVGKESDIFVVANAKGEQLVLKIHRLGRISFRTVKNNRDYLRKRSSASWMYMSRLAAVKEFTFMKALSDAGIPVPNPIAQNRHHIVMGLIDGFPLRQISSVPDPAGLYAELIELIMRLARIGLIHGDFNEFNIMIKEEGIPPTERKPSGGEPEIRLVPVLIDFPQMVSIDHPDAKFYFDRDVGCIKRYFERKFHFVSDEPGPFFEEAKAQLGQGDIKRLDIEVEASGFSKKMAKELEAYMKAHGVDGDAVGAATEREEVSDEEEDRSDEDNEGDDSNEEPSFKDNPVGERSV
jgi:RIO kinase 2